MDQAAGTSRNEGHLAAGTRLAAGDSSRREPTMRRVSTLRREALRRVSLAEVWARGVPVPGRLAGRSVLVRRRRRLGGCSRRPVALRLGRHDGHRQPGPVEIRIQPPGGSDQRYPPLPSGSARRASEFPDDPGRRAGSAHPGRGTDRARYGHGSTSSTRRSGNGPPGAWTSGLSSACRSTWQTRSSSWVVRPRGDSARSAWTSPSAGVRGARPSFRATPPVRSSCPSNGPSGTPRAWTPVTRCTCG